MGIYTVKRKNCICFGTWTTYDPSDLSVYPSRYCSNHKLIKNNKINYNLSDFIRSNLIKTNKFICKPYYELEILHNPIKLQGKHTNDRMILKVKAKIDGLTANQLDKNKRIYFSQFNDESSWTCNDDNTWTFIIVLDYKNLYIDDWERYDY